jgi:hypothetical protein
LIFSNKNNKFKRQFLSSRRKFLLKNFVIAAIFSVFLLASCTATKNETANNLNSAAENKPVETIKPEKVNPESNLLNACLILPKEEVERILGQAVESANLSRAAEGTATVAALSQCTYQTTGGQTIEFFARRSPTADNTPEEIEEVRETMKRVTLKEVEEISGVGSTAFWVPLISQLHVFAGENIYLFFTMKNFKETDEAKTKSVEMARQALDGLSAQKIK